MADHFDIWKFLAGLGIFLFGMFFVEDALKNLAGRSFKKLLRQYTNTPLKGILSGTVLTAILQSSSVVSLMVLAFVGAGIIKLKNAIGVIFGTNLGTTFTGWIVVLLGFKFDIQEFALPMVAIGGISLILFSRIEKIHETGRFLLGFGLLFLGLEFMKISIGSLAGELDADTFQGWNPYLFFPIGLLLTAIIQSSSAVMVISLSALGTGIISIESAAVLVIGSDLGTTVTTVFGAIKGSAAKKRVALSHILINIISAVIALILLYPILYATINFVNIKDPLFILVFFHSSFNLLGIIIVLPFIKTFAQFLENRFTEDDGHIAEYVKKDPFGVPEAALENLRLETESLIDRVIKLNLKAFRIDTNLFTFGPYLESGPQIFKLDNYLDSYSKIKQLEGEIVEYYLKIQNEKLDVNEATALNRHIQAVHNAMSSSKQIKDIKHNLHELENSSNDSKQLLYIFLKGQLNEFYYALNQVYHSKDETRYFEKLVELLHSNHKLYTRFLKEVYTQIELKKLTEIEISTLLTVNREIHNANKNLILAVKEAILSKEESEKFNTIPELQ